MSSSLKNAEELEQTNKYFHYNTVVSQYSPSQQQQQQQHS